MSAHSGVVLFQAQRARRKVYARDFKLQAVRQVRQGATITQVARHLGVSSSMLARWAEEARRDPFYAFRGQGQPRPLHAALGKLQRENIRLKQEMALFKEGVRALELKSDAVFAFIDRRRALWPVRWMCTVFGVSPSGYYDWIKRQQSST